MRLANVLSLTVALGLVFASPALAGDTAWPTWRGPNLSGIAPSGANPPVEFSESKNIKWKVQVPGTGSSTPVVSGDRIFLLTAIDTGKSGAGEKPKRSGGGFFGGSPAPTTVHEFRVLCYNRGDGELIWQTTVTEAVPHEGTHKDNDFASGSPVTDGKHVWASFGSRGVHCVDIDGKLIWSRDFGRMKTRAGFGEGASPALASDALIVVRDHEGDSAIYALDKMTGKTIWEKSRNEATGWSTPIVLNVDGREQVIVNATANVTSYDAKTGEVIWECSGQTANAIPSPVTDGRTVYCTSGFRGSALYAIALGHEGKLDDTSAVRWKINTPTTPYVPSPILVSNRLYLYKTNSAILSCYNAETGEPYYTTERLSGMRSIYASPVAAGGRLYLTGRSGEVAVIRDADKLDVLAVNELEDEFDASPAIVGNQIILRGVKNLYCIAE